MEVKAQIARPVSGSTVQVGQAVRIFGAAWSGEAAIAEVQVQTEEGGGWQPAALLPPESRYGWRLWEMHWTPRRSGRHAIRCRAIDTAGHVQPDTQQPDRESYVANWIVPVEVNAVVSQQAFVEEFVI
jgi:hypothetical protein